MRMAQTDYELTAEEEARMELEYRLDAIRWPIEDEGYIEALDNTALILRSVEASTRMDEYRTAAE